MVTLWQYAIRQANGSSGCSTLLKSIAGELDQLRLGNTTYMNYQGVPGHVMHKEFRGEAVYQAETDVHFHQLTVKETLEFAARARACRIMKASCSLLTGGRLHANQFRASTETWVPLLSLYID